jgi:hypothetical protein
MPESDTRTSLRPHLGIGLAKQADQFQAKLFCARKRYVCRKAAHPGEDRNEQRRCIATAVHVFRHRSLADKLVKPVRTRRMGLRTRYAFRAGFPRE